ncbi:hypothetical protein [Nocardioides jiangxiensis]|uniref:DUF2383 domain-containing protein n=1 Tax=Nocardioides jiangxiensis TaxID=3064524 RepID=A0ABT9B0I1_9ACTN|nr:hypothetical protein [Nocardioides sp. WY-20]MDO7868355.1 hypothetical protein [Nocardioides sp. WY-20]
MSHLARYMRTHLAGSSAGVDLFDRAAKGLPEPAAAEVRRIQRELVEERKSLRRMMKALGVHENPVFNLATKTGERIARLKPNGDLLHRTAMTDLTELEAMVIAVSGKHAGWESLLAVADHEPRLDRAELRRLRDQARDQRKTLRRLHAEAAARALVPGRSS